MGLLKKVKEILFEEEEYTEQIKITPEMRNEEPSFEKERKVPEKTVPEKKEEKIEVKTQVNRQPIEVLEPPKQVSERDLFQTNSNYPFLDFDEKEFEHQKTRLTLAKKEKELFRRNKKPPYARRFYYVILKD